MYSESELFLGAVILLNYPITDIILNHSGINFHFYADDTQFYGCVDPRIPGETDRALTLLSNCISCTAMDFDQAWTPDCLQDQNMFVFFQ